MAIDGYVADSDYPSAFHTRFQPTWIDAVLRLRGIDPPREPRGPFTLVDLGCGDGYGLIATAVAHPEARFVGIDAMHTHVARGNALIARLGLPNVALHCADFRTAATLPIPRADYVTAQGVLAWVSTANRAALLDLATRLLRPGGVFAVGYNALPGWQQVAPFQRLVRLLAQGHAGSPVERFEAAVAQARASGALASGVFAWLETLRTRMPADYFAHEYLDKHWAPCWADEVIRALRARGCSFACEASTVRLRDDLTLRSAWRAAVASMNDVAAREVAIDLFVNRWYRTDLYMRDGNPAEDREHGGDSMSSSAPRAQKGSASRAQERSVAAARGRMDSWWRARASPEQASWTLDTPAGRVAFDNRAARAILVTLQAGPARLADLPGLRAPDLLNAVDALWLADLVHPAEPPADVPHATAFSAALAEGAAAGSATGSAPGSDTGLATGSTPGKVMNVEVSRFGAFVPLLAEDSQRSSAERVSPSG